MCKLMRNASNKWATLHINLMKVFLSKSIWQHSGNKCVCGVCFSRDSAWKHLKWPFNIKPAYIFAFKAQMNSNTDEDHFDESLAWTEDTNTQEANVKERSGWDGGLRLNLSLSTADSWDYQLSTSPLISSYQLRLTCGPYHTRVNWRRRPTRSEQMTEESEKARWLFQRHRCKESDSFSI